MEFIMEEMKAAANSIDYRVPSCVPQKSPRRLFIYAHYDISGQVDDHVIYQLEKLKEICSYIIFVSNSSLAGDNAEKLPSLVTEVKVRDNSGYDWTAWKDVILEKGEKFFLNYDELILCNSSCYGPLFPLTELFERMNNTRADFWGLTCSTDKRFKQHLQSYFICIKKNVFLSNPFWKFFNCLQPIHGFTDAIFHGEIGFSQAMLNAGFTMDSYVPIKNQNLIPEIGLLEPYCYTNVPSLLLKHRLPFIKIKAFRSVPDQRISHACDIFEAIAKTGSPYPIELIKTHLRRATPLSWQKSLPDTLLVLPVNGIAKEAPNQKIGIFLHLFYPDSWEIIEPWLRNFPVPFDLLVTCPDYLYESIREQLDNFNGLAEGKFLRSVENRGRDILPWLIAFKEKHFDYDIALKLHVKKSNAWLPQNLSEKWYEHIIRSTLGSKTYILEILDVFRKDQNIGIIFHTSYPLFNLYSPHAYEGCVLDKYYVRYWLDVLGLNVPEETSTFVHPISIFWYRPRALQRLLSRDTSPLEFPPEPLAETGTPAHGLERAIAYIAQGHGYSYRLITTSMDFLKGYKYYEDSLLSHWNETTEEVDGCQTTAEDGRKVRTFIKKSINYLRRHKLGAFSPARIHQVARRYWFNRDLDKISHTINIPAPIYESPQPKDTSGCSIKALAFYLPQFHSFPENDLWWGKGFTEWTNVTRARPTYTGHSQPKCPANLGYYDLSDIGVMRAQWDMAKSFGLCGFCVYYYDFNGKILMHKPMDNLLKNTEVDFPFCLCWCNENWTRRWDGKDQEILIAQKYSPEQDRDFALRLIPYMRDHRYMKIQDKPILLVYNVREIPNPAESVKIWRDTLAEHGIAPYLVMVHFYGPKDPLPLGFDAAAQFRPHELKYSYLTTGQLKGMDVGFQGMLWDYSKIVGDNIPTKENYPLFRGVCTNFDNTARRGVRADMFVNSTPALYEQWLDQVCEFTDKNMPENEKFIFINSWNEWAEGSMLEPDMAWGFGYLNATSRVLAKYKK